MAIHCQKTKGNGTKLREEASSSCATAGQCAQEGMDPVEGGTGHGNVLRVGNLYIPEVPTI